MAQGSVSHSLGQKWKWWTINNLFNFKSIVTWFYTQSMPSDIYALSRTRGLYGATFHPHASCMSQTHTATCMELRIGFLSRHPRPPLFPLLPTISQTQTRLSLLIPTSFHYPPPSIPRKSHLHSVPSYAMGNWNWLVPRKDSRNPLMIRCASQLHLLPLPRQEKGVMSCPVPRLQGYHVFPLLSPDPEHKPPPHCWTCPSCHRRRS